MVIHRNLTKVNYTRMPGLSIRWIVIHYTGNKTDKAVSNTNYFKSVNRSASANYFVGDDGIYMCVDPKKGYAWHCGKDYSGGKAKYWGKVTNRNSIGIEMCSTNGKISDTTWKKTVWLTRKLMKEYNIPASHVVRHYDVCQKQCPGWTGWLPSNESLWKKFKNHLKPCVRPLSPVTADSQAKYIRWIQRRINEKLALSYSETGKWNDNTVLAVKTAYKKYYPKKKVTGKKAGPGLIAKLAAKKKTAG